MTEYDGQFFRRLRKHQIVERQIAPLQDLLEEKAQSRNPNLDRAGRQLPFLEKMDLIMPQLFGPHLLRRLVVMFGQLSHSEDVAANRFRRIVTPLKFFQHALTKLGHKTSSDPTLLRYDRRASSIRWPASLAW